MSFLAPAALALVSLSIPLVVLYMLRSRRRRFEVPSVRMWENEEQFVAAALPWQRLRITAALILQLLALIAFALLLARPFFTEESLLGPHTVMVMDVSGSMAMADRLESAKARARDLLADASDEQLVSIVEAGPVPRVLAAFSRDPDAAREVVAGLEAGGGVEDLSGAIRMARGLATPDRPTSLLLFTDGGVPGSFTEPVNNAAHLAFDAVGDNVAIAGFGTGGSAEGRLRVFVEFASFSSRTEEVTAALEVNGLGAGGVTVSLEPGERVQRLVPIDAGPGELVEVRLVDHRDSLPLDDASAMVLSGGVDISVAVLGEGSVFLDALLASVVGITPAVGEAPDVVILDGGDTELVDRPAWLVATDEAPPGLRITGEIRNPIVTYQRPGEPILEGIDLSDLAIAEAAIVEGQGWLPIVSATDAPLILLGDIGGHRAVYFTFDLTRSNLPVQVSFPIIGARILEWLGGSRVAAASTAAAGTPIALTPPPGSTTRITRPDGTTSDLVAGALQYTGTGRPGPYGITYVAEDGTTVPGGLAVRQFVASESPGAARTIEVTESAQAGSEESTLLREWAPWILAALVLLVLAEWWVAYGRPGLPRRSVAT